MKKVIALLVVALIFVLLASCDSAKDAPDLNEPLILIMRIQFDKTSYHVGEPITLKAILENVSEEDVVVNGRLALNSDGPPSEWDVTLFFENGSGKPPFWGLRRIFSIIWGKNKPCACPMGRPQGCAPTF